jgi:hypothetical protein
MSDVWLAVVADMEARRLTGIERYGKPVLALDAGEDWLRHAYEESLDQTVYLKAELLRREAVRDLEAENARLRAELYATETNLRSVVKRELNAEREAKGDE